MKLSLLVLACLMVVSLALPFPDPSPEALPAASWGHRRHYRPVHTEHAHIGHKIIYTHHYPGGGHTHSVGYLGHGHHH
ncbi:hypothetical protein Pcinc_028115 [Petrolisthes cinctipes]|uniref:Uncharacterized protein n=1 Tax=Petrolisthes cinctipes TaxID=88211 RepID=A0AAE1K7R1_PETCI|nr:hypothetical protein Pcinc_028115 [Petrolisthes cinctipes]